MESKEAVDPRAHYSSLRKAREAATFTLMRMMDPSALDAIRKEFFAREDSVGLEEFIYLIEKHLLSAKGAVSGKRLGKEEFTDIMYELFKDIDVNGDGDMEWEELTKFIVEKANTLNSKTSTSEISHYTDKSDDLDPAALTRRRNEYSRLCPMANLGQFAAVEEHSSTVHIFNLRTGKEVNKFDCDGFPIAVEYLPERNAIAVASSDSSLNLFTVDDPVPSKRFQLAVNWQAATVQMCLAWMPSNELLYSGGNDGNIYAWDVKEKNPHLVATMQGHSDIIMCLLAIPDVDNLVSASLDTTICLWDTYTHHKTMRLTGHKKGVFSLSYHANFRLLISSGFDHDAFVWSPFVKALVYKLKGHHASLIGVECIKGTDEIVTADADGVFKLWDIRSFKCMQSFSSEYTAVRSSKDSSAVNCFFHVTMAPINSHQKEDDARIFSASKMFVAFDQERVVHEATTDFTTVNWIEFNAETSTFVTCSEKNLIIWDALLGSRTISHSNIAGAEISACTLDDRKRKIVIGTMNGRIDVYNPLNAQLMKSCPWDEAVQGQAVVSLEYDSDTRRFIAGYANGLMRVYDEGALEDCPLIKEYDHFHGHPELLTIIFNSTEGSLATAGSSDEWLKLWDYSSGKMEVEIDVCDPAEHIVEMIYLNPHPYVATADSRGNVVIWGSRLCRQAGQRVGAFLNQAPAPSVRETFWHIPNPNDRPHGLVFAYDEELVPQYRNPSFTPGELEEEIRKEEEVLASVYSVPTMPTPAEQWDTERAAELEEKVAAERATASPSSSPGNRGRSRMGSPTQDVNAPPSPVSQGADAASWGPEMQSTVEEQRALINKMRDAATRAAEEVAGNVWGRALAANKMAFLDDSKLLFTGDEHGTLRCFDVSGMFEVLGNLDAIWDAQMGGDEVPEKLEKRPRTPRSALLPVHERPHMYHFGQGDVLPNLGVNFAWGRVAQEERITVLKTTPHGVITSGDDLLVKMWDVSGVLIGTLLQSVPIGRRSAQWGLDLDVVSIMEAEQEELMGILEEIHVLDEDKTQPNIYAMDFSGLQPGAKSEQFSRSELRQRIEMTREVLGINFPVENEVEDIMAMEKEGDGGKESDVDVTGAPTMDNSIAAIERRKAMRAVERDLNKYFNGLEEDQRAEYKPLPVMTPAVAHLISTGDRELGKRASHMKKAAVKSKTYAALDRAMRATDKTVSAASTRDPAVMEAMREARALKFSALRMGGANSIKTTAPKNAVPSTHK